MSPSRAVSCCRPVDGLLDPELFKALCDPTRCALLACLIKCGRPASVSEIGACCAVDLSVVSRHLATLERAGVLEATKKGRGVFYGVRYGRMCETLRGLADAIEECCPEDAACGDGAACGC